MSGKILDPPPDPEKFKIEYLKKCRKGRKVPQSEIKQAYQRTAYYDWYQMNECRKYWAQKPKKKFWEFWKW